MGQLVFSAICSLDLYVADTTGSFGWAAPDEEVHAFVDRQERRVGTHLLGRRMYDVLKVWDTFGSDPGDSAATREFASSWRSADKIVYSSRLAVPETGRTRVERTFDPATVRAMTDAAERDVSIGGPTLAATALRAGIVDRVELYLSPVLVGGGTPALPRGVETALELVEENRFRSGVVYLAYTLRRDGSTTR